MARTIRCARPELLRHNAPTRGQSANFSRQLSRNHGDRHKMTRFFQEARMFRFLRAMLGYVFSLSVCAMSFSPALFAQAAAAQTGKEITVERLFRPPSL